jgi:surface antigen
MRNRRRSGRRVGLTRRLSSVLLLGIVVVLLPLLHPERVSAASGVDDYPARLKNAPQDSLVDPWQFYNRECTSWVAWRLNSENDVPFNDYFEGVHWGNASNWKHAANTLGIPVDNNPTRGAVAWWAAGSAGSSRGHVAWVEAVGNGAITIEEYNYLQEGYYDTRTISDTSSLWPSGFIHIKDTVVRNTAAPTVSGTPQVGVKLITTNGTWSTTHLTFHYQWLANGRVISGATRKSFVPTAAQLGVHLRAQVTATKAGAHSGSAKSPATHTVAHGVFTNSVAPVISGTPQVGVTLSATSGTWSPAPTVSYQWYAGSTAIAGATASTFTPTAAQLGSPLTVRVTARAQGYRTMGVLADATDAVAPGQFTEKSVPRVTGTPQVDQPLTATPGTWSPSGTVSYQWLADGNPIADATTSSYTPKAPELRTQISVEVTVTQKGYSTATATSAPTDPVAPGTFLNSTAPSITGKPQVGVTIEGHAGAWSPRARISYQWLVAGAPIPGATSRSFTPSPQQFGQPLSLVVTAERAGYLTAVVTTPETADVLPGVITSTTAPAVSGTAMLGHTLDATSGGWSITPDAITYQWYAGRKAIAGAKDSTYQPTADDAGKRLHVEVTASAYGYTPTSADSSETGRVMLGTVTFGKPTVTGRTVVGRTLTAHVPTPAPTTAVARYRWYRGQDPIRGARAATYVLQPADVGHFVHVVVTERALDWVATSHRSLAVRGIRAVPVLHPQTAIQNGRVLLTLKVTAPGLASPVGRARAMLHGRGLGRFQVRDGQGSVLLARIPSGTHTITVIYHGGRRQTSARIKVPVTVP